MQLAAFCQVRRIRCTGQAKIKTLRPLYEISGFRRGLLEALTLVGVGCYTANVGLLLPTFRDDVSVESLGSNQSTNNSCDVFCFVAVRKLRKATKCE